MKETQEAIVTVCDEVKALLLEKNLSYGDSAMHPINIFSNCTAQEQMNVRIDDKLNRIKRGKEFGAEDTELDLIGYLILKRVERQANEKKTNNGMCNDGLSDRSWVGGKPYKSVAGLCECADCAQERDRLPKGKPSKDTTLVEALKSSRAASESPVLR